MLKSEHLARYRDLAVLLTRYGMKDFRVNVDPKDALVNPEDETSLEPGVRERAEGFATKLKEMGPTFIKFGQLLSTRPDIVPPEYIEALEKLQDQVEPFPLSDVEAIIDSELNVRVSKLFSEFEPKPVAAASLGQVHRATLQDGREVVVKVQRPGIRPIIRQDLEVFRQIAEKLDQHTA
ncbi:MAG: AarF/UbiB family protein, partial [Acidobacteriota bacterium]